MNEIRNTYGNHKIKYTGKTKNKGKWNIYNYQYKNETKKKN